jgi:eukaryotic-like serine/threonine-protein kinase
MTAVDSRSPDGRWDRIQTLFEEALGRPPGERAAFLAEECAGEPDLHAELDSLLAAHERAGDFLSEPGVEGLTPVEPDRSLEGTLLGPWRILSLLGRGGMGAVYLAERADGEYERQVALKLVKRGMDTDAILDRFRTERQILARLDHPGIARFLDAGATDDGRPYFVMERIEGTSITRYCDDGRLDLEARIRLFCDVCRAVRYAHANLVVHRDIKPSNLLVTPEGQVKLLDFGIAKVLDGDGSTARTTLTMLGARPLTPEYAAPEQLQGLPVTTAADVYSLGAVLYEILTGRTPFRLHRRERLEALWALTAGDPEQPSQAVVDRPELRRRLRGDLDTIVLTALKADPQRRYPTAEALLEDLRRYLAGHPIAARPDTVPYRVSKFVGRHRTGVFAGVLVAVTLLGSSVALFFQQRQTARERDRAELEAAKAGQVTEFLTGIFEVSDPDVARGDTVTARSLLDRGTERLAADPGLEPAVRAEMLSVLGRVYQQLGLYDQALPLLEEALGLNDVVFGPRSLEVAASNALLASVLHERDEFDRAEVVARRALDLRRELLGAGDTLVAISMSTLASVLNGRGEMEEAERLHREALEIVRQHGSPALVATDLSNLGVTLWRRGRFDEARPLAEEALAIRRDLYGDEHTEVATSLNNLATIVRDMGDYDRAEELYREAVAVRGRLLGEAHPHVALLLNNLAGLQHMQGRIEEAEQTAQAALAIRREAFGDHHPRVAESLHMMAFLRYVRRDNAGAAEYFERALEIWRPELGDTHPNVLTVLHNLGAVRREQGDLDGAEEALREALALRRQVLGEDHPDIGSSHNNLGLVLARKGEYEAAEESFRAALATWRTALGDGHPRVAYALLDLGRMFVDLERFDEAEPLLREALEIRLAGLEEDSAPVAMARLHLGRALLGLDRFAEAEPLLRASYPTVTADRGPDDETTLLARRALREVYSALGRPEEALAYAW